MESENDSIVSNDPHALHLSQDLLIHFVKGNVEFSFTVDPVELGKFLQWAYENRETLYVMLQEFELRRYEV